MSDHTPRWRSRAELAVALLDTVDKGIADPHTVAVAQVHATLAVADVLADMTDTLTSRRGAPMGQLTRQARAALRDAGLSEAQWTRRHFGDGLRLWPGDACGCPDDRCIGYHHDTGEECGCLRALLASERGERA